MKRRIVSVILSVVVGTVGFSQEIKFSGELSTMWGMNAPGTDLAGNLTVGNTDFTGTLEVYQGNGTLLIEGNVNYNALNNQLKFDLEEAYIDYADSNWGLCYNSLSIQTGI